MLFVELIIKGWDNLFATLLAGPGSKEIASVMLDGSAHILGANQIGMTFTTGLGRRSPKAPLHENSIAAGETKVVGERMTLPLVGTLAS